MGAWFREGRSEIAPDGSHWPDLLGAPEVARTTPRI